MSKVSRDDVAALLAIYLIQQNPLLPSAREHALQHLFEVVLYEEEEPVSYSELAGKAAELVALGTRWPEELAQPAVQRCMRTGGVRLDEGRYSLAETTRAAIEAARHTYLADERHFDCELVAAVERAVGRELSELSVPFLTSEVKRAVAEMLQRASVELAHRAGTAPYSNILGTTFGHEPLDLLKRSAETIANCFGLPNPEDLLSGIRLFLGDLDAVSERFVAGLHSKVFYRQILNVDPELHRVQREALSRLRMYLDTNIAIDVLLDEHDEHGATADVVGASRKLGAQLFVSPITVQELGRQIEAAANQVSLASDSRIEAMLLNRRFDWRVPPFLLAFLRARRRQQGLTWRGFVAPYRDIEQCLLGRDILPESEDFDGVTDDPAYQRVWSALRQIRDDGASDNVIDHDSQNFVLIHKLRARYEENILFGPSVWLLTRDSNLVKLERQMIGTFAVRHSFQRDEWGRVLMPYQNILDFTFSDYIAELVQSRLGIIPEKDSMELDFLNSIRHPEFDLEEILRLPEEHAASVLVSLQRDRSAQQLAATLRESHDADERARAGRELRERTLAIALEQKEGAEREARELESRVLRLEGQLSEDDRRLSDLEGKLEIRDAQIAELHRRSVWRRIKQLLRLGSEEDRPSAWWDLRRAPQSIADWLAIAIMAGIIGTLIASVIWWVTN